MTPANINVKKTNGQYEPYDEQKLALSLKRSGATQKIVQYILREIKEKLRDGITTSRIYTLAFQLLRKKSRYDAINYNLKKSIQQLGPSGYHFERFMAHIFRAKGYNVIQGKVLKGKCVSHEVDLVATREDSTIYAECKFHNSPSKRNDVKTALYIHARAMDLKNNPETKPFDEYWIISNTPYTKDAIAYSNCVGMVLFGCNYPHKGTIGDIVKHYGLHPITSLQKLRLRDKKHLLEKNIVICKEIYRDPSYLDELGLTKAQIKAVMKEIELMVKHG
jgi:hypothetical protein